MYHKFKSLLSVKKNKPTTFAKLCIMWVQQINSLFSLLNVLATAASNNCSVDSKSIEKAAQLNGKKTLCSFYCVGAYHQNITTPYARIVGFLYSVPTVWLLGTRQAHSTPSSRQ